MQIILLKPVRVWVNHEMHDKTSPDVFTIHKQGFQNSLSTPEVQHIIFYIFMFTYKV